MKLTLKARLCAVVMMLVLANLDLPIRLGKKCERFLHKMKWIITLYG
jgi:hypothetical protein